VSTPLIYAHPIFFGAVFLLCAWATIFTLISHIGGWAMLAKQFRALETFSGPRWYFQNAQMRWMAGYHNCLTVGADASGLYLSILYPFRIAHPSLFIPWREISFSQTKILGFKVVELRLGRDSSIPFRISPSLAKILKSAAGRSWPVESMQ
jgi:hypothetical protein